MTEEYLQQPLESPRGGRVLKVCGAILALLMVFTLTIFWIYGTDTHHANRNRMGLESVD